jgi:hypothetical protein
VNVAIYIPDEVERGLGANAADGSGAVLEAVVLEAYQTGRKTPANFKRSLGCASCDERYSAMLP